MYEVDFNLVPTNTLSKDTVQKNDLVGWYEENEYFVGWMYSLKSGREVGGWKGGSGL